MITIIGAGPAGSYLAYLLAKKGVTVFEEHETIGLPVQCTGITTKALAEILNIRKQFLVNKITNAKIIAPNGRFVDIKLTNPNLVIDRTKFDRYLAERAQDKGVRFHLNHKYKNCTRKKGKLLLNLEGRIKRFQTDVLVGADGPFSQVAKTTGLWKERRLAIGVQARMTLATNPETVEFFVNQEYFGWIVPECDKTARVGIIAYAQPNEKFKAFLKRRNIDKCKIREYQSGVVPLHDPKIKTHDKNVYLLGDAATHVKATSIDYGEPILIKKNNLIMNIRIGEFINSYMDKYSKDILKEKGDIIINKLQLEDRVYSFSPDKKGNNITFKTIKTILKHKHKNNIFEIILDKGYRVKCTGSHSVMTFSHDGFIEKKVSDLKQKKDYLLMTLDIPNNQSLDNINIIQLIFENNPNLINKVRVLGTKELLFKKRSSIPNNLRSAYWDRNSIPLIHFFNKGIIPENVKITFNPRKKNVVLPNVINISPQFCRLLGYYCAEGSSSDNHPISIVLGKGDVKNGNIADLFFCIKSVFPDIHIQFYTKLNPQTKGKSAYNISFGGRLLSNIFVEILKTGKNAKTKEVPFIIFNLQSALKLEFLKAYLRGDGHCRLRTPKNKRRNWSAEISANTSSRKLISDLIILSLQLELFPSIEEQITKERYLYNRKIKESKTFRIIFSKKEDLQKLIDVFPEKKEKLSKYLSTIKSRSVLNFPKSLIDNDLFYSPKYRKLFIKEFKSRAFYTSYQMFSYKRLLNVLNSIKNKDDYLTFLCNIMKNKIAILQIKKINKIKPTKNEVFDVEIPETNMFVGGVGPIILHNTFGGIVQGLMAAEELSKAIIQKKNYEKLWRKRIGKDLRIGLMIRNKLDKFTDEKYNRLVGLFTQEKIKKILETKDRDYPSRFMLELLFKEPRLLGFAF